MSTPFHQSVEALTCDFQLCTFCLAEGDREEGMLHGFVLGARALKRVVPLCEAHRIRLSFAFELTDRIEQEMHHTTEIKT